MARTAIGILVLLATLAACGGEEERTGEVAVEEVAPGGAATIDALLAETYGEVPDIPGGTGRTGTWFQRLKGAARGGADRITDPPTAQELAEVGDATVAEMERLAPRSTDERARVRIEGILTRLLSVRPADSPQGYRFVVLASDQVNAFMSAGGRGIVLDALERVLPDDGELAFVLAHEIAHGELGHLDEKVHAAKAGWALGQRIEERVGGRAGTDRAPELLAAVVQKVLSSAYDQDQEFEADRTGLALLIRAGYDPAAAPRSLRAISGADRPAPTGGLRRIAYDIVGTHPPTAERVAFLERLTAAWRRASGR